MTVLFIRGKPSKLGKRFTKILNQIIRQGKKEYPDYWQGTYAGRLLNFKKSENYYDVLNILAEIGGE